jgi:small-conductance mechanosensitive channel
MRRREAYQSIVSVRKYGVMISAIVGLLVGWDTSPMLGLAAALALGSIIGSLEAVALCVLAEPQPTDE